VDHSESSAKLLIHLGLHFASFSEYTLISLRVLPDFDSTIRRFESSRPSQPVRRSENPPLTVVEMPASGGLFRIGYRSPGSKSGHFRGENAESLRLHAEIFPFSGDGGWRMGSILTAWWETQSLTVTGDAVIDGRKGVAVYPQIHSGGTQWRGAEGPPIAFATGSQTCMVASAVSKPQAQRFKVIGNQWSNTLRGRSRG
jgi:hypothetical protein